MSKSPKPQPEDAAREHDEILLEFATRLREARLKLGLRQDELASKAGTKQSYIFELESGARNPSLRTIAKMAAACGVDIRELLPETLPSPPSGMSLSLLRTSCEQLVTSLHERQRADTKLGQQQVEILIKLNTTLNLLKNYKEPDST